MKYRQINPKLDSALLQKLGFIFDGYYYVRPGCPIQFNKSEKGYSPTFIDPAGPAIGSLIVTDYSSMINILLSAMPIFLGNMMKKYAKIPNGKNRVNEELEKYWGFDEDLSFATIISPEGIQVVPNNEYSFSLVNNGISKFVIRYQGVINGVDQAIEEIDIECNPQCICWNYAAKIIEDDVKLSDFRIIAIFHVDPKTEVLVPFFGPGIPIMVANKPNK